jgi:hypothetical protein
VIGLPTTYEEDPELLALEVGADEVRADPADDAALQVRSSGSVLGEYARGGVRFMHDEGPAVRTPN